MDDKVAEDHLISLEEALADGRIADQLPGLEDDFSLILEELQHARSALGTVLETVANADSWADPSSALERIGDAVNSERYPVWERYKG